ncbi:AAA family ATPase [Hyalangium versicolor]|uniref:AAA family ATPase n=1 Tax=Hyalangium versicolor TaxID=2861190 RepID=UPI001CCBAE72|nr:AAA family ATPase [Hyalangium versicolor]
MASEGEKAFLLEDEWVDLGQFETTYLLVVFDGSGTRHDAGAVKIGRRGMTGNRPMPLGEFDALDERFFSLGQDENYYETLHQLAGSLGERILKGLRDIADDLSVLESARQEPVLHGSLLRFIPEAMVQGRFHRLIQGDAQHQGFEFTYAFPRKDPPEESPLALSFEVTPSSLPPTNIHVLIGRNGAGKTRCLNRMTRALVEQHPNVAEVGAFESQGEARGTGLFANLVSVTFSAFDPFGPLPEPHALRYAYVGLRQAPAQAENGRRLPPKTVEELTEDFVGSVGRCRSGARAERWRRALETLEADPLFQEEDVAALSRSDAGSGASTLWEGDEETSWEGRARQLYDRLSSGHKIVLLTLTRLVEAVDERTLVLLDEPEAHLHPPLLAAFVRSLSDLLVQRNGVAIIATHSPVVLQEAPSACVWILRRSGTEVRADRPALETFGENVGVLTREVFGLEATRSGFHKLVEEAVEETGRYEAVLERFGGKLGTEARIIARGLVDERGSEDPS